MTKKTSTPVKPPGNIVRPRWNSTTGTIATALSPSMCGRYRIPRIPPAPPTPSAGCRGGSRHKGNAGRGRQGRRGPAPRRQIAEAENSSGSRAGGPGQGGRRMAPGAHPPRPGAPRRAPAAGLNRVAQDEAAAVMREVSDLLDSQRRPRRQPLGERPLLAQIVGVPVAEPVVEQQDGPGNQVAIEPAQRLERRGVVVAVEERDRDRLERMRPVELFGQRSPSRSPRSAWPCPCPCRAWRGFAARPRASTRTDLRRSARRPRPPRRGPAAPGRSRSRRAPRRRGRARPGSGMPQGRCRRGTRRTRSSRPRSLRPRGRSGSARRRCGWRQGRRGSTCGTAC